MLERGKLTIGLPIYNEEKTIRKVLDSIMENIDYIDYIIISDNNSTDATPIICKEYCEKSSKIHYSKNDRNVGSWQNMIELQRRVRTEYYMQLGGHDYLSHNCIKVLRAEIREDVVCCFANIKNQHEESPLDDTYIKYKDNLASEVAGERFVAYLSAGGANRAYYGIMKTAIIKEAFSLYGEHAIYAVDNAIIAYMSLKGKLVYVPENEIIVKSDGETYYEAIRHYRRSGMNVSYINPGKRFYQYIMQMTCEEPTLKRDIGCVKKILNEDYNAYQYDALWVLVMCKNAGMNAVKALIYRLMPGWVKG